MQHERRSSRSSGQGANRHVLFHSHPWRTILLLVPQMLMEGLLIVSESS